MGKPSTHPTETSTSRPSRNVDSAALRTTASSDLGGEQHERYFDQDPAELDGDDDDLPPLYTDHEEFNDEDARPWDPLMPPNWDNGFETVDPFRCDETDAYYLDGRLDRDPDFLANHIARLAMVPPRPFVRILGTHTDKSGGAGAGAGDDDDDKSRETRQVTTDFDIEVELTHLLFSDIRSAQAWRTLRTAGNLEKVRRGTVLATRAPG
ncbi:hypothetical protein E4U41_004164, partial [Claviceps citrina]